MYRIAIRMLIGDRAKYIMLISALTFSALLMTQQSAVFCGLMRWTTSLLRNTQAQVWVVDPNVEQINETKPMRDTDLNRVRSVEGVAWAVNLFQSVQQARLLDGSFKTVILIGVDSSTLIGVPRHMLAGNLTDLRRAGGVIIDDFAVERLSVDANHPIGVGKTFEINDHEARIVGIVKAERSFFGQPYIYTTYERALEMVPPTRRNLSFIIVEPIPGVTPEHLARAIEKETSLKAYTEEEFFWSTIKWYFANTGIPISFGTIIFLGFVVGAMVAGQTFYLFILENLRNLGALKAMGATNALLCRMLILQALLVGVIGYGIGVGLTSIFGLIALKNHQPPFYMPYQVLLAALGAIIFICILAALIGIRRISKLEAAEVFRA